MVLVDERELSEVTELRVAQIAAKIENELRMAKAEARLYRAITGHLLGGQRLVAPLDMVLSEDAVHEIRDGELTVWHAA